MSPLIIVVLAPAMILVALLVYYQNEQESLLCNHSIKVPKFLCGAMKLLFTVDSPIGYLTPRGANILGFNGQRHEFDDLPNYINMVIGRTESWRNGRMICAFDPTTRQISLVLRVDWNNLSFMLPGLDQYGLVTFTRGKHYSSINVDTPYSDLPANDLLTLASTEDTDSFASARNKYIVFTGERSVLVIHVMPYHDGSGAMEIGRTIIPDILG